MLPQLRGKREIMRVLRVYLHGQGLLSRAGSHSCRSVNSGFIVRNQTPDMVACSLQGFNQRIDGPDDRVGII